MTASAFFVMPLLCLMAFLFIVLCGITFAVSRSFKPHLGTQAQVHYLLLLGAVVAAVAVMNGFWTWTKQAEEGLTPLLEKFTQVAQEGKNKVTSKGRDFGGKLTAITVERDAKVAELGLTSIYAVWTVSGSRSVSTSGVYFNRFYLSIFLGFWAVDMLAMLTLPLWLRKKQGHIVSVKTRPA